MYWASETTFSYKEGSFLTKALPQVITNAKTSYDLNINGDEDELQKAAL